MFFLRLRKRLKAFSPYVPDFHQAKKIANFKIPFELELSKGDLDLHIQTSRKT